LQLLPAVLMLQGPLAEMALLLLLLLLPSTV
jgi:hypothetical protein